jgi:hypothetical protein
MTLRRSAYQVHGSVVTDAATLLRCLFFAMSLHLFPPFPFLLLVEQRRQYIMALHQLVRHERGCAFTDVAMFLRWLSSPFTSGSSVKA